MTVFEPADRLRAHRPLLLACEAIGWLHMAGKAKSEFLQEKGGQKIGYDYQKWDEDERPPFPWDDLLKWAKDNFPLNQDAWPAALTEFIRKHTKRDKGLLGLLQAGHGMASGIEKNLPSSTAEYLSQDATHLWLSSAFGRPERNLLADPPELPTPAGWKRLLEQIENLLKELKELGAATPPHTLDDLESWRRWREGAIGSEGWLRRAFTATLAETRLPDNDVTLWDQSYVAAALFKSAAAGAVLEGDNFPWTNGNLKQDTRWRLLTVGIGADHYEARAVRIGDWTGARSALEGFFTRVRKLVEVDLAVGSLLYQDHEVGVFSFPGERTDEDKKNDIFKIHAWKDWLTEQLDGYAQAANLETPPYVKISEPSRALIVMTEEIRKAKETMAMPLHRDWDITGRDSPEGHVCPVCLVRRSKKDNVDGKEILPSKGKPCEICKARRTHRLDMWLKGEPHSDTIWITETADADDRVVLVTLSLDLEPWLNGARLDALRTQAVSEWRKFNPVLSEFWKRNEAERRMETNPVNMERPFDSLKEEIMKRLGEAEFKEDDLLLANLQEGYRHAKKRNNSRSDDEIWKSYFSLVVEDRVPKKRPEWKKDDPHHNAAWLTHQLFRKLASPGRVYRFQRQAEDFFRALLVEFRRIAVADQNRWRTRRLVLNPGRDFSGSWEEGQPYHGRHGDAPIGLLYQDKSKGFLTICNLARLLNPEQSGQELAGQTFQLKVEDKEGQKEDLKLKIESVKDEAGPLGVYHPVIPLDLSPVRFRVLLPLAAASECLDRAVEAWREQFGRVWDRLPLRAGIAAFPRKTPFQAVIEAVRTIESDLDRTESETWRVAEVETRAGVTALRLQSFDGSREFLRTVPATLPDGRPDVFYPYLAVEDQEVRFPLDFRHPRGRVYRHVTELRAGDGVRVYPSRLAALFLDAGAKRFEPLKIWPLADWTRMRGLWKLIEGLAPSRTALHGAWSELAARREDWHGPDGKWLEGGRAAWLDLVRAVLGRRLEARGADLETLVQAARDGVLDWCLEWHLTVLKKHAAGGER